MRTTIPYLCEGEIYQVQENVGNSRKPLRYICKVNMPDGSSILVPNCIQSTMFGGIDDYLQFRSRASDDSGENIETSSTDEKNSAQLGDRVYIAFVGGNIQKPVITGYAQHPNQTYEFGNEDDPSTLDPSLVFKYLGIKATVDKDGQLRLIHRGAPTIDYVQRQGGILGAAEDALAAATASPGTDAPNPAVTPQSTDEITLIEFLKGGVWRLRDSEGQIIEIDRTKKRIYISNNDLKSTQSEGEAGVLGNELATNSTDAEYLLLDKDNETVILNARSIAQIYSKDQRKDVTEGDHSHKIGGDSTITIEGDETVKIDGDQKINIEGDQELDVTGDKKDSITGDWKVSVDGDIEISTATGAFLKMVSGKVTFGGAAAELLDLFDQTLTQLGTLTTDLQAETHIGNLGYPTSPPVNLAAYAAVMAQLQVIQSMLAAIKG